MGITILLILWQQVFYQLANSASVTLLLCICISVSPGFVFICNYSGSQVLSNLLNNQNGVQKSRLHVMCRWLTKYRYIPGVLFSLPPVAEKQTSTWSQVMLEIHVSMPNRSINMVQHLFSSITFTRYQWTHNL